MRWRIAVPPECATPVRSSLNHGYEKTVWTVAMSNGQATSRVNCPLDVGGLRDSRVTHPESFAPPVRPPWLGLFRTQFSDNPQ